MEQLQQVSLELSCYHISDETKINQIWWSWPQHFSEKEGATNIKKHQISTLKNGRRSVMLWNRFVSGVSRAFGKIDAIKNSAKNWFSPSGGLNFAIDLP